MTEVFDQDKEEPVETVEVVTPDVTAKKSDEEIAKEVVAGQWGRGFSRHRRLQEAGYDPAVIRLEVDKIFNQ